MKNTDYIQKGFLFSLGLLPLMVFSVWLFHSWPPWIAGLGGMQEFAFDKSQILLGEVRLSRSDDAVAGLGEVTNRSSKACSFLQLECDLVLDGKIIAHEMAVISDLSGNSTRGFTVRFSGVPDAIDPAKLRVQVALAQAFNLDAEESEPPTRTKKEPKKALPY